MASTQKIIEEKNEKKLSNGHSQLLCKNFAKCICAKTYFHHNDLIFGIIKEKMRKIKLWPCALLFINLPNLHLCEYLFFSLSPNSLNNQRKNGKNKH
jgi:hypothetical protein